MAKTKARELRSDELIVAPLAELIRKRPRSELGHWVARHVLLGRPFTDDDDSPVQLGGMEIV